MNKLMKMNIELNQPFPEAERKKIDNEFEDESSSSKFSWRNHWYLASLIEDLNPSLPTSFQLLGHEIVIWYDNSKSQWVAFDDKYRHCLVRETLNNALFR